MAGAFFSHLSSFGSNIASAVFGNRTTEADIIPLPFPPKAATMNLPSKRALSQTGFEEDTMQPAKRRRSMRTHNTAQRARQQLVSRRKASFAAKRIAVSAAFRNSLCFIQMVVNWNCSMLDIPEELKHTEASSERVGPSSDRSPFSNKNIHHGLVQAAPTKDYYEHDLTLMQVENQPVTPTGQLRSETPPSLSFSATSSDSSPRNPATPTKLYNPRGLTLQNSKFADADYEPPARTKSWGLADYPRQKQMPGSPQTVRIYLGDHMQPAATLESASTLVDTSSLPSRSGLSQCYVSEPQTKGFVPSKGFDLQAEIIRREAAKMAFNAEAQERIERDIDSQYYARWCFAVINAGELVYDPLRTDPEVSKSRWGNHAR